MRLLVVIANHGTKNQNYVSHLIETFRKLKTETNIVVLSNVPKDFGTDIEVRVGAPSQNPWSLPFGHRGIFVEQQDNYDLFIYTEDDTEITQKHIDAFLDATEHLPKDRIAGFFRYEVGPNGQQYYTTVHRPYYWDPNSVIIANDEVYAHYTNVHSACYILTREHLKSCIKSGGFELAPHEGRYDMLCAAATDPYTRCGFQKVVCVSSLDKFSLHHMPNIYLDRFGTEKEEVEVQMRRLNKLSRCPNSSPRGPLFQAEAALNTIDFDKNYLEPLRSEVLDLMQTSPSSILSIGCEQGLTEGALIANGHQVAGVPIDSVIAVSAEMRGVRTTPPDLDLAKLELVDEKFDYLLFINTLPYFSDPASLIRRFLPTLKSRGKVIIAFDNADSLSFRRRLMRSQGFSAAFNPCRLNTFGPYSPAGTGRIHRWMHNVGVRHERTILKVPERHSKHARICFGLADRWLADSGAMLGEVG